MVVVTAPIEPSTANTPYAITCEAKELQHTVHLYVTALTAVCRVETLYVQNRNFSILKNIYVSKIVKIVYMWCAVRCDI